MQRKVGGMAVLNLASHGRGEKTRSDRRVLGSGRREPASGVGGGSKEAGPLAVIIMYEYRYVAEGRQESFSFFFFLSRTAPAFPAVVTRARCFAFVRR